MKYRVEILPQAWRDLDLITAWIAERSPSGAERLLAAFERRLDDLQTRPESFGLAPESRIVDEKIREFYFRTRRGRTYRGLFRLRGEIVEVLHVRGPGQDLMNANELR